LFTYDHEFHYQAEQTAPVQETLLDRKILRHMDVSVRKISSPEIIEGYDPKLLKAQRDELHEVVRANQPDSFLEVRVAADAMIWPGRWFVMLDKMGAVLVYNNYGFIFIRDPEESARLKDREVDRLVTNAFGKHGTIALAALQFMNCKNVEIIDNPPSRQQRRYAERQGKEPPVTYKTLRIVPIELLRRRNKHNPPTTDQSVMPLHICRGHFKDFRMGPGLGRYHARGMWWWSAQIRGAAERGRIIKDYEIEAQHENESSD